MHDHVAKTRYGTPRDVGLCSSGAVAEPLTGLSDRVEVAKDGVLNKLGLVEDGSIILGVFPDAGDAGADVFQQRPVGSHVLRYRI